MKGWFELINSVSGAAFVLKDGCGEVLLRSKVYNSPTDASIAIAAARRSCMLEELFENQESVDGRYYFNLKAANDQVIGTGQLYKLKANRNIAIAAVMINGTATVIRTV